MNYLGRYQNSVGIVRELIMEVKYGIWVTNGVS